MNDNAPPFRYEDFAQQQTRRMLEHIHRANLAMFQGKPGVARDRVRKSRLCALRAAAWLRAQPDPTTLEGFITGLIAEATTRDLELVTIDGRA
jgi:hypothetical protein